MDLESKIVVITGGASGIGLETVRAFHKEGANVVSLDVVYGSTCSDGERESIMHIDVSRGISVVTAFQNIEEAYGHVDVLVNNAGICIVEGTPAYANPENVRRKTFETNVKGVQLCTKYAAALMKNGGAIVNVSSVWGNLIHDPLCSEYCDSKVEVAKLTLDHSALLADKGIHVAAILPGIVKTRMSPETDPTVNELLKYQGEYILPRSVASVIVELAADPKTNGALFVYDRGLTAQLRARKDGRYNPRIVEVYAPKNATR